MSTTAEMVLNALTQHHLAKQADGTWRCNNPMRPGSNSQALHITVAADGEHGVGYDFVAREHYTLYQIAEHLSIPRPSKTQPVEDAPETFDTLAAYAERQGVPESVFVNAGWRLTKSKGRAALVFPVDDTFKRYRYLDSNKPKYMSEVGYTADVKQWYGLEYAVNLAIATGQPLVICNGEASTLVAQYYGVAACCVPGGEQRVPEHLITQLRAVYSDTVLVAFDSDKAGRETSPHVAGQLLEAEYNARAIDLGGGKGFDLANFCKLYKEESASALLKRKEIGAIEDGLFGEGITASELRRKEFQPLRWAVEDILPEGCTLLAGKPKARKSWLALNIGLAVSLGGRAMGVKQATKGTVLYLDLESNQRRAQRRLDSALRDGAWPDNFHIFNEWPKLDAGGEDKLDLWMKRHPDTSLVVIDVFQDIRAAANPKAQIYTDDRAAVEPLRRFASRHHVAVLIIHHTRKSKGDDVFDEISGSTGLTGGVDNIMVLTRDAEDGDKAALSIRGRDIEFDNALPLTWDFDFCQWRVVEDGIAVQTTKERKELLELMTDGNAHSSKALAAEVGKEPKTVNKLLRLLERDGIIACVSYGKYKLVDHDNNSRSGRSSGTSGNGRSSGSGMDVPVLPLPPMGYREVEVFDALECEETPTSTTSTTSTTSADMQVKLEVDNNATAVQPSGFDWPYILRLHRLNDVEAIRRNCFMYHQDFDAIMNELNNPSSDDAD